MSQDLLNINWEDILKIENLDPNLSFENFYSTISPIVETFLPLKKVSDKVHKRKFKPWISLGIRRYMKRRDKTIYSTYTVQESVASTRNK